MLTISGLLSRNFFNTGAFLTVTTLVASGCLSPNQQANAPGQMDHVAVPSTPGVIPPNQGRVAILIHDAPNPYVDNVFVTIDEVKVEHDALGWLSVFQGSKTIDLLALQSGVVDSLGFGNLPAGSYSGIRMHVTSASVVVDGDTLPLDIPSGDQSGIKINQVFNVPAGHSVSIALDWDVGAHLIHNKGKGYILRPTLFAQITTNAVACATVTFADANLEARVRQLIGKPSGTITGDDVAGLTILSAVGLNIASISGIECLRDLVNLNLLNNKITDLSPVAQLANLTLLNVELNLISDISPIAQLTGLKTLVVGANPLGGNIQAISGLTGLEVLGLNGVQLTSLSAVAPITGLKNLSAMNNQITSIAPLTGFTALFRLLLLNNKISDISVMSGLTALEEVNLETNLIATLPNLGQLSVLRSFNISGNAIGSLQGLSGLTSLRVLAANGCQLSSITPVATLTGLETFNAFNNQISNISPLANLPVLKVLQLPNNQVQDMSAVATLPVLQNLNLLLNQVTTIPNLTQASLNVINLNGNLISNISGLSGLPALSQLALNGNPVADVSPIQNIATLTFLSVLNTGVHCGDSVLQQLTQNGVTVICN